MTINETKVVLEVITVCGKTMREHLEVINYRDAISYVEDVIHKEEPFSEWQIKNLHRHVLKGIDDSYAGVIAISKCLFRKLFTHCHHLSNSLTDESVNELV